ncbi:hypothetical protein BDQ17DRAFT_1409722 [Cyathus striatus]|nr:hypothetical protein BDQ17DRAFT_1409722 [Cyathus striatus]
MFANAHQPFHPNHPTLENSQAIFRQPRHYKDRALVVPQRHDPFMASAAAAAFVPGEPARLPGATDPVVPVPSYAGMAVWGSVPMPFGTNQGSHWQIFVYGQRHVVPRDMIRVFESYNIRDVLSNSLAPLTHQYSKSEAGQIKLQAATFFSAFDPKGSWDIKVDNLPHELGRIIEGVTANSRKLDIGSRFMRFRFPHVLFEISSLNLPERFSNDPDNLKVKSLWKAWARGGPTSGIVAYGTMRDNIHMSQKDGKPLFKIITRTFEVIQVLQPELLAPIPYPAQVPPVSDPSDFLVFSTSWTVIRFLRKSEKVMTFLISLSALLAALQPIVSNSNKLFGWILAGIGVLSGLISVLAVLISWALGWIEVNAARRRQYHEN